MKSSQPEDRSAVFSDDRTYRYRLLILWDKSLPLCNFIGLNPSIADEFEDDPTIRRCKGYCRDWGCGGLVMTNLFAFCSTDPKRLKKEAWPIGEAGRFMSLDNSEFSNRNDAWIHSSYTSSAIRVAAWGGDGAFMDRGRQIADAYPGWMCLGRTIAGHPLHPLYLKKTTPLERLR